ncbi:beta-N-acetylhexosaminidase [Candidatus Sumerlaeota bacterium]|nr:beta-N-acetylhexosaminidase [Candidatus Sumerlaeota bacterium]
MFSQNHKPSPCRLAVYLLLSLFPVNCFITEESMASTEKQMGTSAGEKAQSGISIIPAPSSLTRNDGAFTLNSKTKILAHKAAAGEAEYFSEVLSPALGYDLSVKKLSSKPKTKNTIIFDINENLKELGDEGYRLNVDKIHIRVEAMKPAGIFYACQTIRQLLPPPILSMQKVSDIEWTLPCLSIEDKPRYEWRGQLFDCCRHFFPKETVFRAIDLLALHKMNRLHWHITEDQGWRLEIKKYPKLTEIGAWRKDAEGNRYGGFYTQNDVREILDYARKRHIIVVPEIEMPGHSRAALASYPELGCTGGPYEVGNLWGVFNDVYCAGNEYTFEFIQNVLDEVLELFPSEYIHIGGDECPKEKWKECPKCQERIKKENLKDEHELQSYFIKRIDRYLTSKGRRLVGWDEILEGGLAPGAVVQSWRGVKGGIQAANENHEVIMSPTSHCYLDYPYDRISLEKAYSYEPVPEELTPEKARFIKGLEGNIWTEHVPSRDRLDYQAYPRLSALAEVAWSPKENKNWEDFESRMAVHYKRLTILGVKYGFDELAKIIRNSTVIGEWKSEQMKQEGVEMEWDISSFIKDSGKFNIIFYYTKGQSAVEIAWAALFEDGKEIARDTHDGWSGGNKRDIIYAFDLSQYKTGARYTLKARLTPNGNTDSNGEVRIQRDKK